MTRRFFLMFALVATCLLASPATTEAFSAFQGNCNSNTSNSAVCADKIGKNQSDNSNNPIAGPNGLLVKIADIVAYIAGGVAVILLVISGLRYILSDGDSGKAKSARQTAVGAVVGLAIIVLARMLIVFVVNKLYPGS